MGRSTPDELVWLEGRWRETLRALFVAFRTGLDGSVDALAETGALTDAQWSTVVERVAVALAAARARCGPERQAMYAVAISLLQDTSPILQRLTQAADKLAADDGRIVGKALRQGLLAMRFAMTADSEERGRTWSRLDRTSRELHRAQVEAGEGSWSDGRCHDQHFRALETHIRANDLRLPRTAATISLYFHEFCGDCHVLVEGGADFDWASVGARDLTLFPSYDASLDHLEACLGTLPETLRTAVQVSFHVNEPRSMDAFCAETGTNRFKVRRLMEKALPLLAACISDKVEAAIR